MVFFTWLHYSSSKMIYEYSFGQIVLENKLHIHQLSFFLEIIKKICFIVWNILILALQIGTIKTERLIRMIIILV